MNTLAVFYPGCIEFEILLACEILNEYFPVKVTTPDGSDHIGSNGLTIKADYSFAKVDPNLFKIILVPGGDPGFLVGNNEISTILQKCNINKAIIGAICAGPLILDQAKLLDHRRVAHGYEKDQFEFLHEKGFFKNVKLTDEPFIIEENILTARPESFIDFAVEIAQLAACIPKNKVEYWKNYYRGIRS